MNEKCQKKKKDLLHWQFDHFGPDVTPRRSQKQWIHNQDIICTLYEVMSASDTKTVLFKPLNTVFHNKTVQCITTTGHMKHFKHSN